VPYYVVPHGSALEYTVRGDARYHALAREGLACAAAVVWISANIRARVLEQFPDLEPHLLACGHHIGIGTDTTRFRALSVTDRDAQRHALAADHRSGGKRAAQREALRQAIKRGDIEATRRDWNSYDHGVEDEDFAERLPEIPVDGDVIAFVGALTWGKGVQSLVAAMPRVLRARPEAHLVIIGSGTYREVLEALVICLDTGNREMFEAIARRGRGLERDGGEEPLDDLLAYADTHAEALFSARGLIASRVHFIGRLDHPRLARLLPCARVAVFPSIIHEASPLVFAEALACGVLPAASNHSGFADGLAALQADLPASLWSPMHLPVSTDDRIETMAANVTALLERTADPALPERLRAIATARYDWSSIVEPLVRLGRALMVNV
jgi:glycosyltransferase involved in cell wall biosynthesis